ncbi:head-tail connector protein [Aerococcus mictus]|uniref:head-tail connector protein n=1 Tax=Aerococcus mictus TaxID=2976810 RepID=UPI002FD041EE
MAVTVDNLKAHLNLTSDADDALLADKLAAALEWVAKYTGIPSDDANLPGRTDMLAAIFGGNKEAEDSGNTSDLTALEGEARQNALKRFAALGDLTVQRMP